MRVGIYGRTAHPAGLALAQGFESLGHRASHREQSAHRGEVEPFDLVIAAGMRTGRGVVQAYSAAGIPVVVYDFGYLSRVNSVENYETGHWQVGIGGLNRPPGFACPGDRFEALDLPIIEQGGDPSGYVLLCGQVPGDAAHGMNPQVHRRWLQEQFDQYENVVYRPHPKGGIGLPGAQTNYQPLSEAFAGARLVVTYNSNIGHDALMAGVPVVCGGPAAYGDLSGEELPDLATRRAYFQRLAYGQWTVAEMASGECPRFLLDHLISEAGFGFEDAQSDASEPDVRAVNMSPSTQTTGSSEVTRSRRGRPRKEIVSVDR